LIINEPKKYDLKGAFNKSNVDNNLNAVIKNYAKVNLNDILSTNSADFNRLKEADITAVVKELDIEKKDGVGVLFVMEAMRKIEKKGDAAIWVTFVDLKSKKVLMTERIEVKASAGFGFRNYWASTIKNLIDLIGDKKYKEWKQKYSS
jgi:3-methyladenine DNA glycosylase AlkC